MCCYLVTKYGVKTGKSWGECDTTCQIDWKDNSCDKVVGGKGSPKCKGKSNKPKTMFLGDSSRMKKRWRSGWGHTGYISGILKSPK